MSAPYQPAYVAIPDDARSGATAIVMIMHLGGVDAAMRDAARQFADAGFAVAVPDLYARLGAPHPDETRGVEGFMPFAKQLTTEGIDADVRAATAWLRDRFPVLKMVILGFCMGGRIAMHRTVGYAGEFDAAAIWYGFDDTIDPSSVDIPIVASYGQDDVHIPADKVKAFGDALVVAHDFKIYPNAGHGFFHKESAYAPQAAADSFARTVRFLNAVL